MPWSQLRRTVTVLLGAVASLASAAEPPPPAEAFFHAPEFSFPRLAPDGKRLGALIRSDARHQGLALITLNPPGAKTLIRDLQISVWNFWWKSDDRVVVSLVDDDGRRLVQILDLPTGKVLRTPGRIVSLLPDDPEAILLDSGAGHYRYELRTGRSTTVEKFVSGINDWITDPAGRAWAGVGFRDRTWTMIWRSAPGTPWQRREQHNVHDAEIYPLGVTADAKQLVVVDRLAGSTAGLAFFELATGAMTPIFRDDRFDTTELGVWGFRDIPCAALYHDDRLQRHFFLPEAEQCYRSIATALGGEDFHLTSFSRDERRAIAWTVGDRNPGKYFLVDRDSGRLDVLGARLPALPPQKLAPSRPFQFKSRDGLQLSGRIILPPGIERPPVVVCLGPGLPGDRTLNEYDASAQFFASRGFAAVRIHVRGTSGFGRNFRRAGDLQVGTGMVNDLEDGLAWLATQGWVDAKRAALFGQSWGGIVALQAATHGGYRALVNFATPLLLEESGLAAYSSSDRALQELAAMFGDVAGETRYLRSIDPRDALARLSVPSFHYYPRSNTDALPEDARRLRSALRKNGPPVVFHEPPGLRKNGDAAMETGNHFEAAVEFLRKETKSEN